MDEVLSSSIVRRVRLVGIVAMLALNTLGGIRTATAQSMYWTNRSAGGKIHKANIDGTGVQELVSGLGDPVRLALDMTNGKMYWVVLSGKIQRANLDGTSVQDVIPSGLGLPTGIDLDVAAGKMYWISIGGNRIDRANFDGTSSEFLTSGGIGDPRDIRLDLTNGKMYYISVGSNQIARANLDGSSSETVIGGLGGGQGLALDIAGNRVYWVEQSGNVRRAALDGSGAQTLVSGGSIQGGIELNVAAGHMYWANYDDGRIRRANLDGTGVVDLFGPSGNPYGVRLDIVAPDNCPGDPNKTEPGICGCGVPDDDSDSDGVADCDDICPGFDDNVDDDNDGVPDGCDVCEGYDDNEDCNSNTIADACETLANTSPDCNSNLVPDECETDCNTNNSPDDCDLAAEVSLDCNSNTIPDECEAAVWDGPDGGAFMEDTYWDTDVVPYVDAVLHNETPDDNRSVMQGSTHSLCHVTISASGAGRQILHIFAYYDFLPVLTAVTGVDLQSGAELRLEGGDLAGGLVSNGDGAFITGFGRVIADLNNAGRITCSSLEDIRLMGDSFVTTASGSLLIPPTAAVLSTASTNEHAGNMDVHGLGAFLATGPFTHQAGGEINLWGGLFDADGLYCDNGGRINGFGTFDTNLWNSGEMTAIADTQIVGDLDNSGLIQIQSGTFTVTGNLSNSGTIIGGFGGRGGDPCGGLVINGSYILGENATLRLGCGTLKIGGNFDVAINDYERFDMTIATLQMAGLSGTQLVETLADDAGTCATLPEPTLFSIGTLRIGPTPTTVKLVDNHVNSVGGSTGAEVLYVRQLTIETGARLDLGGRTLYYATSTPANPTSRVIDSVGGGRLVQLGVGGGTPGDINGDCTVNLSDIPLFIQVLLGLDTMPSRVAAADINASGVANGEDVGPFVQRLLTP